MLQHGRIAKNECFSLLDRVAGFLTLGDASQAEYGHKNFLELVSAFTTPPMFMVIH